MTFSFQHTCIRVSITLMQVFSCCFGVVLPFRERDQLKRYICTIFTDFQQTKHAKTIYFSKSQPGV